MHQGLTSVFLPRIQTSGPPACGLSPPEPLPQVSGVPDGQRAGAKPLVSAETSGDPGRSVDVGGGNPPQLTQVPEPRSCVPGQPIRGSDSQLCPKPPPKPSKVLLSRLSPPSDPPRLAAPPPDSLGFSAPPVKPAKQLQPAGRHVGSSPSAAPPADPTEGAYDLQPPLCSHVERLRREEAGEGEAAGRRGLDRSSYHHAIASLEYSSEEEEEQRKRAGFLRPLVETESTFRPADFGSRLLPAENKPLEMLVLKRAKELLLSHQHQSIAAHLLKADCQVGAHVQAHAPSVT